MRLRTGHEEKVVAVEVMVVVHLRGVPPATIFGVLPTE